MFSVECHTCVTGLTWGSVPRSGLFRFTVRSCQTARSFLMLCSLYRVATAPLTSGLVSAAGQESHRWGFILVEWAGGGGGGGGGDVRSQEGSVQSQAKKLKQTKKKIRGFDQHNRCRISVWICYHGNGGSLLSPWCKYRPRPILPCFYCTCCQRRFCIHGRHVGLCLCRMCVVRLSAFSPKLNKWVLVKLSDSLKNYFPKKTELNIKVNVRVIILLWDALPFYPWRPLQTGVSTAAVGYRVGETNHDINAWNPTLTTEWSVKWDSPVLVVFYL